MVVLLQNKLPIFSSRQSNSEMNGFIGYQTLKDFAARRIGTVHTPIQSRSGIEAGEVGLWLCWLDEGILRGTGNHLV